MKSMKSRSNSSHLASGFRTGNGQSSEPLIHVESHRNPSGGRGGAYATPREYRGRTTGLRPRADPCPSVASPSAPPQARGSTQGRGLCLCRVASGCSLRLARESTSPVSAVEIGEPLARWGRLSLPVPMRFTSVLEDRRVLPDRPGLPVSSLGLECDGRLVAVGRRP